MLTCLLSKVVGNNYAASRHSLGVSAALCSSTSRIFDEGDSPHWPLQLPVSLGRRTLSDVTDGPSNGTTSASSTSSSSFGSFGSKCSSEGPSASSFSLGGVDGTSRNTTDNEILRQLEGLRADMATQQASADAQFAGLRADMVTKDDLKQQMKGLSGQVDSVSRLLGLTAEKAARKAASERIAQLQGAIPEPATHASVVNVVSQLLPFCPAAMHASKALDLAGCLLSMRIPQRILVDYAQLHQVGSARTRVFCTARIPPALRSACSSAPVRMVGKRITSLP